jgi:hypothetical protein
VDSYVFVLVLLFDELLEMTAAATQWDQLLFAQACAPDASAPAVMADSSVLNSHPTTEKHRQGFRKNGLATLNGKLSNR